MARRRTILRRGTRRLRPVEWGGINAFDANITTTPVVFGLTATLSPPVDLISEYTQPTLMRIRGHLLATEVSDETTPTLGHVGIIAQIPNQTSLVPATVDPSSNPELEWIWWHPIILDPRVNESKYQRIDIDSKAMRKLNNGEQLYLWAAAAGLGDEFDLAFSLRYLLKE